MPTQVTDDKGKVWRADTDKINKNGKLVKINGELKRLFIIHSSKEKFFVISDRI